MKNKKIIIGVTGSIAAYKTATLVRLLVKAGAEVKVITTAAASQFIAPLTFSVLSKNEVIDSISNGKEWHNHVDLGLWADLMVVAPASANTIAKMAHGLCDNMLLATYLSARCPVWIAPAMDVDMWHHFTTQENIKKLANNSIKIVDVANGELASGLIGEGRMAEPEAIFAEISEFFSNNQ